MRSSNVWVWLDLRVLCVLISNHILATFQWNFPSFRADECYTFFFICYFPPPVCVTSQRLHPFVCLCFRNTVWLTLSFKLILRQLFWQQMCGVLWRGESDVEWCISSGLGDVYGYF